MIPYIHENYVRPLIEMFRPPDRVTLAARELADAERRLLAAESGLDYATAMVRYETARVTRLTKILNPTKEIVNARPNVRPSVRRVR